MPATMPFPPGTRVRERGKQQIMIVAGQAGLAAVRPSAANIHLYPGTSSNRPGMVVCKWTDARGRPISKAFPTASLELADAQASGASPELIQAAAGLYAAFRETQQRAPGDPVYQAALARLSQLQGAVQAAGGRIHMHNQDDAINGRPIVLDAAGTVIPDMTPRR